MKMYFHPTLEIVQVIREVIMKTDRFLSIVIYLLNHDTVSAAKSYNDLKSIGGANGATK